MKKSIWLLVALSIALLASCDLAKSGDSPSPVTTINHGNGSTSTTTIPGSHSKAGAFALSPTTYNAVKGEIAAQAIKAKGVTLTTVTTTTTTTTVPGSTTTTIAPTIFNNSSVSFDLGTLTGSQSFLFILQNTGTAAINNIVITRTAGNSLFSITPDNIVALQPDGSSDFIPVINITATHGNSLSGNGFVGVLPAGANSATFQIVGTTTTTTPGDTLVTLTVTINVNALVAQVTPSSADTIGVQSNNNQVFIGINDPNLPYSLNDTYFISGSSTITYTNTGNVPVTLYWASGTGATFNGYSSGQVLNPGDSVLVSEDIAHEIWLGAFRTNGVIANPVDANGNAYSRIGANGDLYFFNSW